MKVLILGSVLKFVCVPRIYPSDGDTITLYLRDELSQQVYEPKFEHTIDQMLSVTITDTIPDFKAQQRYEIEITIKTENGYETIYKGILLILEQGTDVQNYTNESQSTNKFKFRE